MKKLFRRVLTPILFIVLLALPVFGSRVSEAVSSGIRVCTDTLIPTLFPFLFFSSLLSSYSGAAISRAAAPITSPLFGISPASAQALIFGVLGGFPTGALIAARLFSEKKISRAEAERLPIFCNNAGPMFVIATVGTGLFSSFRYGLFLYLVHLAFSFAAALLTRPSVRTVPKTEPFLPAPAFSRIFSESLFFSVRTMSVISASFLLFRAVLALFTPLLPDKTAGALVRGTVELTSGLLFLSHDKASLIPAAALLGFNGFCIQMQTATAFCDAGLSLKPCLIGKLAIALGSAVFVTLFLYSGIPAALFFYAAILLSAVLRSHLSTRCVPLSALPRSASHADTIRREATRKYTA